MFFFFVNNTVTRKDHTVIVWQNVLRICLCEVFICVRICISLCVLTSLCVCVFARAPVCVFVCVRFACVYVMRGSPTVHLCGRIRVGFVGQKNLDLIIQTLAARPVQRCPTDSIRLWK